MAQDKRKNSDGAARRVPEQSRKSGEAQNVRDEAAVGLDRLKDVDHARNKATEGARQNRDTGSANSNNERKNLRKGK